MNEKRVEGEQGDANFGDTALYDQEIRVTDIGETLWKILC